MSKARKVKIVFEDEDDYKTWTITFSESVENHVGMEQIGDISSSGFSIEKLEIKEKFEKIEVKAELINLEENLPEKYRAKTAAKILIIREGIKMFLNKESDYEKFVDEVKETEDIVDKKAWMRGRVVNKLARYNLCYGDKSQKADYEEKKGTVVSFDDVEYLSQVRSNLSKLGSEFEDLFAELNYYYDNRKCGISFHGDSERRKVIGLRIGSSMDLQYQWFLEGKPVGDRVIIMLNDGDLYFMSEKAVGTDWKRRKVPTLRHAAGCKKYTTIKE